MGSVDLNLLRATVLANQSRPESAAPDPNAMVVVDRNGNLVMGPDVEPNQQVSRVPNGVFA